MRAVWLRARGALRRRWKSAVGLAVIVAVVSGTVLTLVAGARRTAAAPDAYTAAVGGDVDAALEQPSGFPLTAEIEALPGVESVQAMTFLFAGALDTAGAPIDGAISFAGDVPYNARLVEGRTPDPGRSDEFVADKRFVAEQHARVGDVFPIISWTQEQGDNGEGFGGDPRGPSFDAHLVGIMDTPDKLEADYTTLVFSTGLLDEDVARVATVMGVRTASGVTLDELRTELDTLPDGSALSIEPGRVISEDVRNAVDAQARGTWLMALVATVAAIVALGQLLTRAARRSEGERGALNTLGYTKQQFVTERLALASVPALVGVATGAALAIAASGVFPAGFVRPLEPRPGVNADAAALIGGGCLLVVCMLAWVGVGLLTSGLRRTRRAPSRTGESIARTAHDPAAATGARFALSAHDGSSAASFGTLLALALIVAGLVAATAFAVSLDRLVSDRGRFGSNYTFAVGDNSGLTADQLREAYADDPDIERLMILSVGAARRGRDTVEMVGVEPVSGGLAPRVLTGRLPTGPDELALGRITAHDLGLHVGDEVPLDGTDGRETYRVVGLVVVPTIAGNDGVGLGAVVTADGLLQLEPEPDTSMAAIVLRPDALPGASARLAALANTEPGIEDMPSSILNLARVRRIPGLLAGLLAALALLTMIHTLIVSINGRRRDLAVLRALGADRHWISRTVHWQATVLTVLPLVLAVPLGIVAGSFIFRGFADSVGAVPDPAIPIVLVGLIVLGLVLVANVAAIIPARRARRLSTAQQLQPE